jgi:hypothetical protein
MVSQALAAAGFALDESMPHTRNERRYMLYQRKRRLWAVLFRRYSSAMILQIR